MHHLPIVVVASNPIKIKADQILKKSQPHSVMVAMVLSSTEIMVVCIDFILFN